MSPLFSARLETKQSAIYRDVLDGGWFIAIAEAKFRYEHYAFRNKTKQKPHRGINNFISWSQTSSRDLSNFYLQLKNMYIALLR